MDEYRNISTGLLEAPEHISTVYENRDSRYIAEALLTDPHTPFKVYTDLFGWSNPDDPELYRKYFFDIPKNLPRMKLVKFIAGLPQSLPDEIFRFALFKEIFDKGWEIIDEKYNKSANIEVRTVTQKYLRKLFTGMVPDMVDTAIKSKKDVTLFQQAFKALKDSASLELSILKSERDLGTQHEQLKLSFVEDVQAEGQKSKDIAAKIYGLSFDELCNLQKPEDTVTTIEGSEIQTVIADFEEAEIIDSKASVAHTPENNS